MAVQTGSYGKTWIGLSMLWRALLSLLYALKKKMFIRNCFGHNKFQFCILAYSGLKLRTESTKIIWVGRSEYSYTHPSILHATGKAGARIKEVGLENYHQITELQCLSSQKMVFYQCGEKGHVQIGCCVQLDPNCKHLNGMRPAAVLNSASHNRSRKMNYLAPVMEPRLNGITPSGLQDTGSTVSTIREQFHQMHLYRPHLLIHPLQS